MRITRLLFAVFCALNVLFADAARGQVVASKSPHTNGRKHVAKLGSPPVPEPYSFTTLAGFPGISGSGNGMGAVARFNTPYGVAVDSAGNIYVADTRNHMIRKVNPAGEVTTLAGLASTPGYADDIGSFALFNAPFAVGL